MYTQDGVENLKKKGQLEGRIEHYRSLLANLESATVIDDGEGFVKFAHLSGRYSTSGEFGAEVSAHVVWDALDKRWPLSGFASEKAAEAYARAAVISELKAIAKRIKCDARKTITQLEAAR